MWVFCFFFSSRRRHTRYWRDWSSDVCSSDLLNDIKEYGADYTIDRFDVGHEQQDLSHATLTISAEDEDSLQRVLMRLQTRGLNQVDPGSAETAVAEQDGVFPDGFYSTTNLATKVRVEDRWVEVENPEMDCGLVVEGSGDSVRVRTVPMVDIERGMRVVVGAAGIEVAAPSEVRSGVVFGFMESDVDRKSTR